MKKALHHITRTAALLLATTSASWAAGEATNVIFFLGDGMGPTTVTASRIYKVGEAGQLTMESLRRTARIRTFSNDAQTTDSAPSMAPSSMRRSGVEMVFSTKRTKLDLSALSSSWASASVNTNGTAPRAAKARATVLIFMLPPPQKLWPRPT